MPRRSGDIKAYRTALEFLDHYLRAPATP